MPVSNTSSQREPFAKRAQSPTRLPPLESEASRRELVRRIVNSPTFAKSERLGTLLTYICDMAIAGREGELAEQKIGADVFGRAEGYDSAVDGIVRSQVSRLRQRLDLYFQQEGVDEPVQLTIPRGGYAPVFASQKETEPVLSADAAPAQQTVYPARRSGDGHGRQSGRLARWLPWAISAVLACMLLGLWMHGLEKAQPQVSSLTHPFWGQLFSPKQPAMIVAPDSGLILYRILSSQELHLNEYIDGGYRSKANDLVPAGVAAKKSTLAIDFANRRYTSMVDLDAILSIRDRAKALGSDVSVRYARDLRPNDLKRGTVVLLGSNTANPWVELFQPNLNFLLKDDVVGDFKVINRAPRKGEPAEWVSTRSDSQRHAFGIIAYVPSLEENGDALLLEGAGMSGTEAALDFLNDDTQLSPFLEKIRRPDHTIPHFELLIETRNMDSSSVQSHVVAWRTMK
ncbi:hypothetical protein [Silvibacterium acidisoli]|uniref:hypothetical protein n=1 Tax=Acidobacteriaceae bacterium ZG23-2 TaxID=2883246 RepID=UPI00406CA0FE